MTEEVSLWCIPLNYFFQQLACQLQGLFLMEMAEPSELKWVKNSFVVRMAQIGVGGGGERDHQKHLFPLQKTHQTQHIFFSSLLSVAGEKKIQEWAARWRENRRVETEEAGLSRVVFVFHTECWLTADGLLSGWSSVKETEGIPPPETLHPPSHITILIPRRGRIQYCEPSGPERLPTPQTLMWGEKDANRICLQDCK